MFRTKARSGPLGHVMQRFWRDAHAGLQHAIHTPGPLYHSTALTTMGAEPQGPLRAMI